MGKGMKAGKRPKQGGGGKKGQMAQLQQVQMMQKQMEMMQAELDEKEVTATAGGGVISAVINGKKELVSLTIDKDVVDPDDVETLQDLVIAAVNEGMRQIDEMQSDEYGKITGGLDIPGL
jgi:DNA-binding YbaB/EbfC family protein